MRRFLLLIIVNLSAAAAFAEEHLPLLISSCLPVTDLKPPSYQDDRDYPNFAGRLYVAALGIDVALYLSNDQEVVDRKDSAAYFDLSSARGCMIVADHNTHAFSALSRVKPGDTAYIMQADGTMEANLCTSVFKGHNTGTGITDWQGNSVVGCEDLMMYTCFDGWQNVWVVLWSKVQPPEQLPLLQRFENVMSDLIDDLLTHMQSPSPDTGEEIELMLQLQP